MIHLNDLPELENIIDFIEPENEINNNAPDIIEICLELMDDYISNNPHAISDPDFEETLMEDVLELLQMQIEMTDAEYDEFEEIFEYSFNYYFEYIGVPRSYPDSIILNTPEISKISEQLIYLKSKPQPTQRTPEWYQGRHNMITASNAYKAFETQSVQNQLIYEKCQPLREHQASESTSQVNINTTLHWGQKYEPLSVMIYEYIYKTKVDDFGCIPHDKYNFIGASPDGINVDESSERYGRMLEIKNIVNREIDGIPKKEYWVQMQMQMETCDLPECDFLETKFEEYETYEEFINEPSTDKRKGIIMYYANSEGNPKYIYSPPNLLQNEEFDEWEQQTMDTIQDLTWIKSCYWKLEIMSCVLVPRNKRWFESNVQELQDIWSTILIERETGYEHRAPNKRVKPQLDNNSNTTEIIESVCLIDLSGKIKIE